MSNHLAIATVTASIQQALQSALNDDVPGAQVKVGRPASGDSGEDAAINVNLFLYQVAPNTAIRNTHLASRGSDGRLRGPDIVALDLFYLLSFNGPPADFVAERLLGSVARIMEHRPLVTSTLIAKAIIENPGLLDDADLARASERVRASLIHLSLDEMSKLWSVLFQVPYALSVAYRFGPVFIESVASGSPGLPISQVGNSVLLMGGPRFSTIEAPDGPGWPILWGGSLVLKGDGFLREGFSLRIRGFDVDLSAASVTGERIVLPLVAASFGGETLHAGAAQVEAVMAPPSGAPAHLARISDSSAFILRPSLSFDANALVTDPGLPISGTLTATFSPAIAKGQAVFLLLDGKGATRRSYRFRPEPIADPLYPADTLAFAFTGVEPDSYHAQVLVDGVASAPEIDDDPLSVTYRQILGPTVTIP
jgi:hypothetical protein